MTELLQYFKCWPQSVAERENTIPLLEESNILEGKIFGVCENKDNSSHRIDQYIMFWLHDLKYFFEIIFFFFWDDRSMIINEDYKQYSPKDSIQGSSTGSLRNLTSEFPVCDCQGNQLSKSMGREYLEHSCWFFTSVFAESLDLYLTCLLLPQVISDPEDCPLFLCFAEKRKIYNHSNI